MTKSRNWLTRKLAVLLVGAFIGALAACGGGGGSDVSSTSPTTGAGTISGTVIKGPVSGATVNAYGVNADGTIGAGIGHGQTDKTGHFSFQVGTHEGPVYVEALGGTYMDEATGTMMSILVGNELTVAIPFIHQNTDLTDIEITPLTYMAQVMAEHMAGGMTKGNIDNANAAMGRYFNVDDIIHTHPMDPLVDGSATDATQPMVNYGMTLAAMSMYSVMQGVENSSDVVYSMVQDAADGRMDGFMDGTGVVMGGMMGGGTKMPLDAGTLGLADAMMEFLQSGQNRSGATYEDMIGLMDRLRTSNGMIY